MTKISPKRLAILYVIKRGKSVTAVEIGNELSVKSPTDYAHDALRWLSAQGLIITRGTWVESRLWQITDAGRAALAAAKEATP